MPILRAARSQLEVWLRDVAGASVEDNVFSVSIHWRGVAEADRPRVAGAVDAVLALAPFRTTLRKFSGKCVFELRPSAAWNKGEAALYLLAMVRQAEGGAPATAAATPSARRAGIRIAYISSASRPATAGRVAG